MSDANQKTRLARATGSQRRWVRQAIVTSPAGTRMIARRNQVRDIALDRAMRSRWGSSLVADALYRALVGRRAGAHERRRVRAQARSGMSTEQIVEEISNSPIADLDDARARVAAIARAVVRDEDFETQPTGAGPRVVFLHTMKVGGTSLSDALYNIVPRGQAAVHLFLDDLVVMPPVLTERLRVIAGHIPFEALSVIPGTFRTATILRDPVDRTISHFQELRRSEPTMQNLTLEQFVFDDSFGAVTHNYQARQLVHEIGLSQAWRSYSPERRYEARGGDPHLAPPLQSMFDAEPLVLDDDELCKAAVERLDSIDHVGTTDRLDLSAAALARMLSVPVTPRVARLNATADERRQDRLARPVRARLEEITAVDRHLYELAQQRGAAV